MAMNIEDAGFEIRDMIAWVYGSGFPKSLDVSKAIDKAAGVEREVVGVRTLTGTAASSSAHVGNLGGGSGVGASKEVSVTAPATPDAERWQGWGTALKPAFEPIVVARKPFRGTVAANVLEHGTGALNIDGCRIGSEQRRNGGMSSLGVMHDDNWTPGAVQSVVTGRWPANVILSEDQATELGEAARFFYCAKAPTSERPKVDGQAHATVKPLTLMRWLVQLVTPPGGIVGDPFAGSGTTLEAAYLEGFSAVGVELEDIHIPLIRQRLEKAQAAKLKEVIP
jgi:site-specific DNA-methyltransferase (adenine-specific)